MEEYSHLLNKIVYYPVTNMTIEVEILEIRKAYGRYDVRIRPITGEGSIWVNIDNLRDKPE